MIVQYKPDVIPKQPVFIDAAGMMMLVKFLYRSIFRIDVRSYPECIVFRKPRGQDPQQLRTHTFSSALICGADPLDLTGIVRSLRQVSGNETDDVPFLYGNINQPG